MANKLLAGISLFLCFFALGLTLGSINAENWVYFDDGIKEREFGLFRQTGGVDLPIIPGFYC